MFKRDDNEGPNGSRASLPMLTIHAEAGNATSRAVLVESDENVETETLFDNEARPKLAIFTLKEEKAIDIRSIGSNEKLIPLGIYLSTEDKATLDFIPQGDFDMMRYQLYDRETGRSYRLDESNNIVINGTCLNRFYLVEGDATTVDEHLMLNGVNDTNGVYITTEGQMLTAHSKKANISGIEVFDYDGKIVASVNASSATKTLSIATNIQIGVLRIHLQDLPPVTHKFIKQ